MQSIRQQTHLRSALMTTAERRLKPAPLAFLIDGTADQSETLRFPRTTREAFGHYAADAAPKRITFLQFQRGGWCGIAAAVLVLAFFIGWGWK